MPELPEVETVVRGLATLMEGATLIKVEARRPDLRFPLPAQFIERTMGHKVHRLYRRAKYGLIEFDAGHALLFHLGMSGRMRILPKDGDQKLEKHDHVIFSTDKGAIIAFNDPRRFGFMDIVEANAHNTHKMLADIGPEPLSNHFNAISLANALHGRKSPIKAALLDQRVVAGIGNIYASEALFEAGISPKRKAQSVQGVRAERLAQAIRDVLAKAIAAGGSSLKDYARVDGELGYFQHQFRVYGREEDSCLKTGCGGTIKRLVQSGRSTFYCPTCQR